MPGDSRSFLDWLMGRAALKKAADPIAATAQPVPTSQTGTAQTDLARQIAANPNNQPQPDKDKMAQRQNRWPKSGAPSQ